MATVISEDVMAATRVALAGFLGALPGESFDAMCERTGVPKDLRVAAKLGWDLFPWHAATTLTHKELTHLRRRVQLWRAEDWTLEEIYYVMRLCRKGKSSTG